MKSMLKSLMLVAAVALALTSCSNDATEEVIFKGEPKALEVNATIDQTRTTLAGDHVNMKWSDDDEISLYIGATATEANKINPSIGGTITATYNEGDAVYANYSLGNSFSQGVKQAAINIIAEQSQSKANVFAGKNLPMVAMGIIENGKVNLRFSPVGCVLVFNVYGPVENEEIKSITFTTSVGCSGYQLCDLTTGASDYTASPSSTSVTVTLGTPAAIGAKKPEDTKIGSGNQVYMVVAPVNYEDATITVTTNACKYTFKTAKGIDCSANTARVVNLNLANAPEIQPTIEVPTVREQPSEGGNFIINNIVFRNFEAGAVDNAVVDIYSDAKLTQPLENSWLTFNGSNSATLLNGQLNCNVAPNGTTENRTAYIGIKCAGAQAAIAITQVAQGSTPAVLNSITADLTTIVGSSYKEHTDDTWIVTFGGNGSLGSSTKANAGSCTLVGYPAVAQALGLESSDKAAAVISKIALPAGYNTATLKYTSVQASTQIGIAFSADGVSWTGIMAFVDLKRSPDIEGSKIYSFPQQGAGYYAFVAKATANDARIQNCKITYSQQ